MNDNKKIIRRNRKTVILVSAVSVCLCVSLLIGSAVAGFHAYFDSNADGMTASQYNVEVSVTGTQVVSPGPIVPVVTLINTDDPAHKTVNSYAEAYLIRSSPINCILENTEQSVKDAARTTLTITASGTSDADNNIQVQGYAEITISAYAESADPNAEPVINPIATYYEQIAPGTTVSFFNTFCAATEGQQIVITVLPHWGVLTDEQQAKSMATGGFTQSVTSGTMLQVQEQSYSIVIESSPNGKVTADKASAVPDETVTVTVTPDEGYETESVYYVTDDLVNHEIKSQAGIYSFKMPSQAVKISAAFKASEPESYNVTVSDTIVNGSISADKSAAAEGDEVTVIAVPAEGYVLESLSYNDGTEHSINIASCKFTMPAADVVISGTFKAAPQPEPQPEPEPEPGPEQQQ